MQVTMTMAANSITFYTTGRFFSFFFYCQKDQGNYEKELKSIYVSSELSYLQGCHGYAQLIRMATSQQPEMPLLVHDCIFILRKGQSQESQVQCLQMTQVSKLCLQFRSNFICFLKYISHVEFSVKQMAYLQSSVHGNF